MFSVPTQSGSSFGLAQIRAQLFADLIRIGKR